MTENQPVLNLARQWNGRICITIQSEPRNSTDVCRSVDLWSIQFRLTSRTVYPIAMWDRILIQPDFWFGNPKSTYWPLFPRLPYATSKCLMPCQNFTIESDCYTIAKQTKVLSVCRTACKWIFRDTQNDLYGPKNMWLCLPSSSKGCLKRCVQPYNYAYMWSSPQLTYLRGYCTTDQFCDCLCIFLKNYNTLVTSKICFL